jgi:hypothetical protein
MGLERIIVSAAAAVLTGGCGPTPGTSGSGEGGGSDGSSTIGETATSTSNTASSDTGATSTGTGLECPDENVFEGDLTLLTGDDPMGLYGLTEVKGRLTISSDDIVDLSFLSCLRAVDQLLVIENDKLESFEGLEQVTRAGTISARDNPVLESLRGLDALREVVTLGVWRNPSMTTLGLDGLERVLLLRIGDCSGFTPKGGPGLTDIVGLSGLRGEIYDVFIVGNEDLVSLDGLRQWADNGVTISGFFWVMHNRELPTTHAAEITELFGGGFVCANEGDEGPWDVLCECEPAPPDG